MRPSFLPTVRALVLATILGVLFSTSGRGADDKAEKEIIKLAELLAKKDPKAADLAKTIAKNNDREDVMNLFGPTDQGGIGIGAKMESFELKIDALGKKGLTKAQLEKESAELKRMAEITAAISETATHYGPKSKKPAVWKKHNDEFQTQARQFQEAIAKKDPAALKMTATKLQSACMACHNDFK